MRHLEFLNRVITNYFTFWIIIFSVIAFLEPAPFAGLTYLIVPTLGVIMLGMGVSLTAGEFKRVLLRPRDVGIGVALQYGVMPFLGFALAWIFGPLPVSCGGRGARGLLPGGDGF